MNYTFDPIAGFSLAVSKEEEKDIRPMSGSFAGKVSCSHAYLRVHSPYVESYAQEWAECRDGTHPRTSYYIKWHIDLERRLVVAEIISVWSASGSGLSADEMGFRSWSASGAHVLLSFEFSVDHLKIAAPAALLPRMKASGRLALFGDKPDDTGKMAYAAWNKEYQVWVKPDEHFSHTCLNPEKHGIPELSASQKAMAQLQGMSIS